ncbi:MAG TPA: ferritin-like domain-containing protein [Parasegetibacter sp.]
MATKTSSSKKSGGQSNKSRQNGHSSSAGSRSNGTAKAGSSTEMDSMLEKLFMDELKDILYAEKKLVKALPKMAKAATSEELKMAFNDHKVMTENQVTRLEEIFEMLGKRPTGKKCEAMEGLVKEAESVIEDTERSTMTRDVGLIISAQKVEHYEIASYGCLAQLARTMGLTEIGNLLAQTLEEEKETDMLLTEIAENNINVDAMEEEEIEE